MSLTEDELVSPEYTIFLQLDAEIAKLREVVKQLIIQKRLSKKLIGKLEECDESQEKVETILRRLKESFKGTG